MFRLSLAFAAAVGAVIVFANSSAQAQTAPRAWVSGHGTDTSGCGAPTAPCRSLQYAHDSVVIAGGEIDVLDPAGYGAVTISKAISIINDGVGTAGVQAASGSAITINAGPTDAIVLRGLNIEGIGAADGIEFKTGASLTLDESAVSGFSFANILFIPTTASFLVVSDTKVRSPVTGGLGIYIHPGAISGASPVVQATLHRLAATDDEQAGVFIDGRQATQSTTLRVTIADSLLADSVTDGVHAVGGGGSGAGVTQVMVRNTTIANNGFGVSSEGGAQIFVGHSTVSGNTRAFLTTTSGVIGSYGDNTVDFNGTVGSATTAETLH